MTGLKYSGTTEMRHLQPGQYVVPLGGDAEKDMNANGGRPRPNDVLRVVEQPVGRGLFGKVKKMEVSTVCADGKTPMALTASPHSKLAVVCA